MRSLVKPGGLVYIEVPDAARYDEHLVAPFHDFNSKVPSSVKSELKTISKDIQSGKINIQSPSQPTS